MSRLKRGMCHEEDIQNILTKLEELETDINNLKAIKKVKWENTRVEY